MQNKSADSTYPMGMERWNPNICGSSYIPLGNRKATDGVYVRRNQTRMYASNISALIR